MIACITEIDLEQKEQLQVEGGAFLKKRDLINNRVQNVTDWKNLKAKLLLFYSSSSKFM